LRAAQSGNGPASRFAHASYEHCVPVNNREKYRAGSGVHADKRRAPLPIGFVLTKTPHLDSPPLQLGVELRPQSRRVSVNLYNFSPVRSGDNRDRWPLAARSLVVPIEPATANQTHRQTSLGSFWQTRAAALSRGWRASVIRGKASPRCASPALRSLRHTDDEAAPARTAPSDRNFGECRIVRFSCYESNHIVLR